MTLKPIISALALFALSAGAQTLRAEDSPRKFVQDFSFWNPDSGDLLSELRQLSKERQKTPK